jgi:hypothetical protein
MVNQKLQEIGQELDLTDRDIRDIRNAGYTSRMLHWIITPLIAVLSFITGFFLGEGTCPPVGSVSSTTTTSIATSTSTTIVDTTTTIGGGYPFAVGLVIPAALAAKKSKGSKIAVLLISTITFLIAIKTYPVFGQAIDYNVYKKIDDHDLST